MRRRLLHAARDIDLLGSVKNDVDRVVTVVPAPVVIEYPTLLDLPAPGFAPIQGRA